MILDRNEKKTVAVLLGAGSMGTAILRRVAAGKKILLGGRRQSSLDRAEACRFLWNGSTAEGKDDICYVIQRDVIK